MIPEAPKSDNGIEITKDNKYSSKSAEKFYDAYYLPLDKIRNWIGSDTGLRRVWLQATYGVTGDDKGGILGGAFDEMINFPKAIKEILSSIWMLLSNPKNTLETINFLCKVLSPIPLIFDEEKKMFSNLIKEMISTFAEKFGMADSYEKGKMIGAAISFVLSFFVSGVGVVKALRILDLLRESKVLSKVCVKVADKAIASKEVLGKMIKAMAEAVELLKTYLNTKLDSLFEIVKETKDLGNSIWYKLRKEKAGVDVDLELEKKDLTSKQVTCSLTGCFTGSTLVTTKTGLKRIDEIVEGEFVLAKDIETGFIEYKQVLYVYKKATKEFVHLNTGNGIINTTPGHLFFTNIGWWVAAENLKAGDKVVTASGETKEIVSVESNVTAEPVSIYNLNVEDFHTYFVGSQGLLVHNDCSEFVTQIINKIRKIGDDILDIMESAGGHTLQKHVSQTNEELIRRAIQEEVDAATSFTNKSTAIQAVQHNLRTNCKEIAQWLESGAEARKIFDVESAYSIGKGVLQDKSTVIYNLTKSRVVLVKDATQDLGFRIITAFPTI